MLEVESLTATLNSFRIVIDLEKEQDIWLVYFGVISLNEAIDIFDDAVLFNLNHRLQARGLL